MSVTAEVNTDPEARIKELLLAKPFRPFEVVVSTGHRYYMRRPLTLAIGPRSMAAVEGSPDAPMMFRKDSIVEVNVLNESAK